MGIYIITLDLSKMSCEDVKWIEMAEESCPVVDWIFVMLKSGFIVKLLAS
jgi:hypothetical protein